MTTRRSRLTSAAAGALLLLGACADPVAPPRVPDVPVRVAAALDGSGVAFLSVEVTGADIGVPIVASLDASGSVASATVDVPAGPARTFTARGYDAEGTLTHAGATTADVAPGAASRVAISLMPVQGSTGGTATDHRVALAPGSLTLAPGATARLTATVTTAGGTPVSSPDVAWATLDTRVATVSRLGLVTATGPGTTQVVAASGGGAAMVPVTVSP